MKIEMVVPALPRAGMEMVVSELTRGLARRGHDVGVTCMHAKGAIGELLEQEGFRVTLAPTPGLRTILRPAALTRALEERRPDVAHIHTGAWIKGARAAARAGVPRILYTMHGHDGRRPWYEFLLNFWAARYTTDTIAVTPAVLPWLRNRLRIDDRHLHVVPNGIDTDRFHPGARVETCRRSLGFGPEHVLIGQVARFSPVKNHAMLLDAFAMVQATHPLARLVLVGDGPLRHDLEARAATLGLTDHVRFLGVRSDLPELYRELDVLALSSFSEAASISILEGMASGLAIVATAVGGTPDLLGHGSCGLLAPSDAPAAFARTLLRLVHDPGERDRLGRAARDRVVACFGHERMLDAYEALYRGDPVPGLPCGSTAGSQERV